MSLFFEHPLIDATGRLQSGTRFGPVLWHPSLDILAVITFNQDKGGSVSLYNEKEELLTPHPVSLPDTQPSTLAWHPTRQIIVIGWEAGQVLLWDVEKKKEKEENHVIEVPASHRVSLRFVGWNASGSKLLTVDESGVVVGFRYEGLQQLFHHDLKETPTQVAMRNIPKPKLDFSKLAKAAVAGDQSALDVMGPWRIGTGSRPNTSQDNLVCYIGTSSNNMYYICECKGCEEILKMDSAIERLMYQSTPEALVILNANMSLARFQILPDGNLNEINKVKLSGRNREVSLCWVQTMLAMSTGDLSVRLWEAQTGDTYVLSLEGHAFHPTAEYVTCLAYQPSYGLLCAGTNLGNICMWQNTAQGKVANSEEQWRSLQPLALAGQARVISCAPSLPILALSTGHEVMVLKEQQSVVHAGHQVAVVQTSPSSLLVHLFQRKTVLELKAEIQIRGTFVNSETLLVWNHQRVMIYKMADEVTNRFSVLGSLTANCVQCVLYDQSVYILEQDKIVVKSFQGTLKQTLPFMDSEGLPHLMDVCGNFLVVGTKLGIIKLWELSRKEAKLVVNPKPVASLLETFSPLSRIRVNCNGSKVSFAMQDEKRLFLWNVSNNETKVFDFHKGRLESEETDTPNLRNCTLVDHFWDSEEPKILLCEAKPQLPEGSQNVLVLMIALPDGATLVQDVIAMEKECLSLMGFELPNYYLRRSLDPSQDKVPKGLVYVGTLQDFAGLESNDKETREALLNFNCHARLGHMDQAYQAIRTIKNPTVWRSLAVLSVKLLRPDIASICLGRMGMARAARAVRLAKEEPEPEAQAAILALQLNMREEAERLCTVCGRYDILNRIYQASNQWEKALEVAEKFDRMHLHLTYYNYAKHLESEGDLTNAVRWFEKSQTHRFEVPRMLYDEPALLEEYCTQTKDVQLLRWWAQYLESTGDMNLALQYYHKADDALSLVRVQCYCGELGQAAQLAASSNNKAACYHVARQFEANGNFQEAIRFFTMAQAFANAVRICKENRFDDQLFSIALMATPVEQMEVARYFETCEEPAFDRAVLLYSKAGLLNQAVDLAFRTQQYEALQDLALQLTSASDPALLTQCAQFLSQNNQHDKAVDLLALAGKCTEAVDLCTLYNVRLTEELVSKLTPEKSTVDDHVRNAMLLKIADGCMTQGDYQLAAKKYTQAGDKVKAMKALLKSGDTEKIIFFANVSRQREIYIMTANYLQSLDWRSNAEVMKNVVTFYTKAKAFDHLAAFYEACAQVEIDEYQNYEKALGALTEALQCLSKSSNTGKRDDVERRMQFIEHFVQIKRLYSRDVNTALQRAQELLRHADPALENAVRRGDIYAFLIESLAVQNQYQPAYQLLEEMRRSLPGGDRTVTFYVDKDVLQRVYHAVGMMQDIPTSPKEDELPVEEQDDIIERVRSHKI